MKELLAKIIAYRYSIASLLAIGLITFTAYQISTIFGIQPNKAHLSAEQAKAKSTKLRADPKTINALRELSTTGDVTIRTTTDKRDPFSP